MNKETIKLALQIAITVIEVVLDYYNQTKKMPK